MPVMGMRLLRAKAISRLTSGESTRRDHVEIAEFMP